MENETNRDKATLPEPGTLYVCELAELPPGERRLVKSALDTILVLNVNGEIYALSNYCPHAGGYMQMGPIEGYILECPIHYWPFDVRNGCLVGMDQPSLDDEKLPVYPVIIHADKIYVKVS